MEAMVCNLLEPGEVAVVCQNGLWGTRFADMVERNGKSWWVPSVLNYFKNKILQLPTLTITKTSICFGCPVILWLSMRKYYPLNKLSCS